MSPAETPEKGVKHVRDVVLMFLLLILNIFTPFSSRVFLLILNE